MTAILSNTATSDLNLWRWRHAPAKPILNELRNYRVQWWRQSRRLRATPLNPSHHHHHPTPLLHHSLSSSVWLKNIIFFSLFFLIKLQNFEIRNLIHFTRLTAAHLVVEKEHDHGMKWISVTIDGPPSRGPNSFSRELLRQRTHIEPTIASAKSTSIFF